MIGGCFITNQQLRRLQGVALLTRPTEKH